MPVSDPKREFAVTVVRKLQDAGYRALWAGGCVRDFLLGRVPKDFDVATNAHPPAVRDLFGHRRTLAVGASFGVIIVLGPKDAGQVEVATFRTEGPYLDGRRPEGVTFCGPEDDAQRRDFTINGMFYDPVAETVHDYVGGEKDLGAGVIRAIGNPADRMTEDKLRLLRAVRFAATMDFQLDPATAEAVRAMAGEIHVVSAERIAQELRKMLVDPHRRRAMELAAELGLLVEILPELTSAGGNLPTSDSNLAWDRRLKRLHTLNAPGFELAFASLIYGPLESEAAQTARVIGGRLRLSNQENNSIGWLLEHLADITASKTKSRAELKRLLAHPSAPDLIALARADALARDGDLSPVLHCEEFLMNTPAAILDPPPLITGQDLIASGLAPGRTFGTILEAVRDAQLNETISTKDEALALVRRIVVEQDEQ